jgi:hypothetical protein
LSPLHEGLLGEWRYSSTHSLTSALDGGEWSASRPGHFTPRERAPGTYWMGGWVGLRAVLDAVVKRKFPIPRWESNPRSYIPYHSAIPLSYTGPFSIIVQPQIVVYMFPPFQMAKCVCWLSFSWPVFPKYRQVSPHKIWEHQFQQAALNPRRFSSINLHAVRSTLWVGSGGGDVGHKFLLLVVNSWYTEVLPAL